MAFLKPLWAVFWFCLRTTPRQIWILLPFSPAVAGPVRIASTPADTTGLSLEAYLAFSAVLLLSDYLRFAGTTGLLPNGTEFLVSHGADRRLVARARAALYYLIVLALPGTVLLFDFFQPDLHITIDTARSPVDITSYQALQGTVTTLPQETDVLIPGGKLLFQGLGLIEILALAMLLHLVLILLSQWQLPRRTNPVLIFVGGLAVLLLGGTAFYFGWAYYQSFLEEDVLFFLHSHPLILIFLLLAALAAVFFWHERRFVDLEF